MDKTKARPKLAALLVLIFLFLTSLTWGQSAPTEPVQNPAAEKAQPAENKISPQEAEELFRSVDDILQFVSKDTGLPIKEKVKRRLTSRDEVAAYITAHLSEDEDAQRLRRSELVLKKFGLIPRDFDLQKFLVAMLREQVAGYYDPKTKYVNLLDWLDAVQQRPVLAHELTHALQDQSFNLEKWLKSSDLAMSKSKPTWAEIQSDDTSTARQAVAEGQGMVVLIDYMLMPMGKTLKTAPELLPILKQGMMAGVAESPELSNAPRLLRESLLFPYQYGLDFVVALLMNGGKDKAFTAVLANPPTTSRQIMQPEVYLSGESLKPMPVPDFRSIMKDYNRFDIGTIGEFDVAILIAEYAGESAAQSLFPQWRGGYYYAAIPKNKPNAPLTLVYVSRWANPEFAAQFAAIYAKSFPKRYQHVREQGRDEATTLQNLQATLTLTGEKTLETEEGPVSISVKGDMVIVAENLDAKVVDRLKEETINAAEDSK